MAVEKLELINPIIIVKRVQELGLNYRVLAVRLNVKEEKIKKWLKGEDFPTYNQALKLTKILGIPFGYLFLDELPEEKIPIPDLRTKKDKKPLSENFKEVLEDALNKVNWLRELRKREGRKPLEFVGKFSIKENLSVKEVAEDIRISLGIERMGTEFRKKDEYLNYLVDKTEKSGVVVLRNSVVKNNTRKPLNPDEFRGFAIADAFAPLVFINSSDEVSAQIFTLFHEIAHIWLGESGVSDLDNVEINKIESFCNRIAAELFLPEEKFRRLWLEYKGDISEISSKSKASKFVVLIRAKDLSFITEEAFTDFYESFREEYLKFLEERKKKTKGGGGDFYRNLIARNSKTFVQEVINNLYAGRIFYREAADLLNIKLSTLDALLERVIRGSYRGDDVLY